jgi:hypothetical protein
VASLDFDRRSNRFVVRFRFQGREYKRSLKTSSQPAGTKEASTLSGERIHFAHMQSLEITISGQVFDHLVYHWVLTYSNWESVTICFSESFGSLNEGLQNAVWELGGVPQRHRTRRGVTNAAGQ